MNCFRPKSCWKLKIVDYHPRSAPVYCVRTDVVKILAFAPVIMSLERIHVERSELGSG
jgi:hypothetical protein